MSSSDSPISDGAYNPKWIIAEMAKTLSALEDVMSYVTYLDAARDQKSKMASPSVSFEREVLDNAARGAQQSAPARKWAENSEAPQERRHR